MADLVFPNKQKMCIDWIGSYTISTAMSSSTAIIVEILNEILVITVTCKSDLIKSSRVVCVPKVPQQDRREGQDSPEALYL